MRSVILLAGLLQLAAISYAQKASIVVKNASFNEVVNILKKQTGVDFLYNNSYTKDIKPVTLDMQHADLSAIMNKCLENEPLIWTYKNKTILITPKPAPANISSANEVTLTGNVTDEKGEAMAGVTITVRSLDKITATNEKGAYMLELPTGNEVLIFRFVGYKTQEISVDTRRTLNVSMELDASNLNAVTVVGYGTQKKISLVGAQSTVSAKDLQQPTRSLANSLAGRIAGVIAVQRTGEPGNDDASIWIRGISTFDNSLSKPLVLIDGAPRSFVNIDPEDIESFTVLKDASATAVYGVRGANGVIIITTKKGATGKPKIRFRYNEGLTSFTKLPEFVDGITYMEMSNEALVTRGSAPKYTEAQIDATRNQTDMELYPNVDWMDLLFKKNGSMRKANLNISGGSEATQYYVSAAYYGEKGLYKTDDIEKYDAQAGDKRYNLTTNLNIKATKSTKIELGVQGYLENANYPGTTQGTIFGNAFFITPTLHPAKYNDGKIADNATSNIYNPYALLTETGYSTRFRSQVYSNLRVTQELDLLTKGLSVTGMFSFDAQNTVNSLRTKSPNTYIATGRDAGGNLIYQQKYVGSDFLSFTPTNASTRSVYSEAAVNYARTFADHRVTALLLYNQSDEVNATVSKASPDVTTSFINSLPYRFRGVAGRTTYGFRDKYFVEGNFGYNGAENLAPENRYGFFPSAGLGWVISEERFFEPLKNVVQLMKMRLTHGIVGNSNITGRRFAYSATVASTTGYNFGRSFDRSLGGRDIGEYSADVTWETARKTNLGMDLTTLNNSLTIQVDVFKEHRKDIFLTRQSLPSYMGLLNNPLGNVGIIENRGIDGSLNYSTKFGNWSLRLQGNFTFNKNKVIEDDLPTWSYPWLERKGRKVGQQFGYIALGLFESDEEVTKSPKQTGDVRAGDIKYMDMNDDKVIDAYDQAPIGYGDIPEMVYGFGFTVGYKSITLSTLFQGVSNMDIWLTGEGLVPFQQGLTRGNLFSNITDRWTVDNPNPDAFYPRLTSGTLNDNYAKSSWWIQSGRYLRLKNIELNVTLPKRWVNKAGLGNANLFVQGVNVFTITPFKMWDVELGNGRGATYPNITTFSAGIDISFK